MRGVLGWGGGGGRTSWRTGEDARGGGGPDRTRNPARGPEHGGTGPGAGPPREHPMRGGARDPPAPAVLGGIGCWGNLPPPALLAESPAPHLGHGEIGIAGGLVETGRAGDAGAGMGWGWGGDGVGGSSAQSTPHPSPPSPPPPAPSREAKPRRGPVGGPLWGARARAAAFGARGGRVHVGRARRVWRARREASVPAPRRPPGRCDPWPDPSWPDPSWPDPSWPDPSWPDPSWPVAQCVQQEDPPPFRSPLSCPEPHPARTPSSPSFAPPFLPPSRPPPHPLHPAPQTQLVRWASARDQARDKVGQHAGWLHAFRGDLARAAAAASGGCRPLLPSPASGGGFGVGPGGGGGGGGGAFTVRAGDSAFVIRIEPAPGA